MFLCFHFGPFFLFVGFVLFHFLKLLLLLYFACLRINVRERKHVSLGVRRHGEDLGRLEGEEFIINIYYMKRNLLSVK